MAIRRLLATKPEVINLPVLLELMRQTHGALDVNQVAPNYLATYFDGAPPITEAQWQATVDAHDPSALTENQRVEVVKASAQSAAQSVPGWSTWTADQADDWIQTNIRAKLAAAPAAVDAITNLAQAKDVLHQLINLLNSIVAETDAIALLSLYQRNAIWPNLEDSQ